MTSVAFDTLAYTEELKNSGVPEKQAMAQVRALSKALESKDLATKTDLRMELAQQETRLVKWMVGVSIGSIGVIIASFLTIVKMIVPG
jgi:hypothetical protein